jgi:acetylornithine aminotransferase/acetylornithine/N-succinyldiaminopimelate aminotransferase
MNKDKVKELDQTYLFQNYGRQDICFDHGEREYLYDLEGKRYIDLVAGIAVNSLGYSHPAVTKTICDQSQRLMHVSNLYLVKEQAEAAEALVSVAPPPLGAVMFVNSGAEANEAALKLAVKATGRSRVLSTRNSFHGRTSTTLSATGQMKYQAGFEPLLSKAFDFIDYGSVEQLKTAITKDTAAFICEPIQGEGGVIPAGEEFFRTARDLCDERGAWFIVDEVQTGMGRTGKWFGFQHYRVVPDIVTLAKALGNGSSGSAALTEKLFSYIYENMNSSYDFKALHHAKKKYAPTDWQPRYLAYYPKPFSLNYGYAILKVQMPDKIVKTVLTNIIRKEQPLI